MTFATIRRPLSSCAASVKGPARSKTRRPRAWMLPLLVATALFLPTAREARMTRPKSGRLADREPPRRMPPTQDRQLVVPQSIRSKICCRPSATTRIAVDFRGRSPIWQTVDLAADLAGGGMGGGGGGGGGMFSVPSAAAPPQVLRQFGGVGNSGGNSAQTDERESRKSELLEMIQSYVKGDWGNSGAECSIFRGSLIVGNTEEVLKAVADLFYRLCADE